MKKRIIAIVMAAMLFAACGAEETPSSSTPVEENPESSSTPTSSMVEDKDDTAEKAVLFADFSSGNPAALADGQITTKEVEFTEKTVDFLVAELSDWTGLNFELNAVAQEGTALYVDWSENSTLIANLSDEVQKDEFHFYDADTMRWFMMDSLNQTLLANLDVEEVYYTMNGGESLTLDYLHPFGSNPVFDASIPYMSSAFYYNHSDNVGDDIEFDPFLEVYGEWYTNDGAAHYYVINNMGEYKEYSAGDEVFNTGIIQYDALENTYTFLLADQSFGDSFVITEEGSFILQSSGVVYDRYRPYEDDINEDPFAPLVGAWYSQHDPAANYFIINNVGGYTEYAADHSVYNTGIITHDPELDIYTVLRADQSISDTFAIMQEGTIQSQTSYDVFLHEQRFSFLEGRWYSLDGGTFFEIYNDASYNEYLEDNSLYNQGLIEYMPEEGKFYIYLADSTLGDKFIVNEAGNIVLESSGRILEKEIL